MADIYHVPPSYWKDSEVILDDILTRRFKKVMRFKDNDTVLITDGKGRRAKGVLKGDVIRLDELKQYADDRLPIDVYLPVIKGERMDWAISKLGELGVRSIIPTFTQRVVVKNFSSNRRLRCEKLLSSSLEIRRKYWKTDCQEPRIFHEIYPLIDVFFHMDGKRPSSHIISFPLSILIGPEGGLSDKEMEMLMLSGAEMLSLGDGVLRAETAAVVGVSIVAFIGGVM